MFGEEMRTLVKCGKDRLSLDAKHVTKVLQKPKWFASFLWCSERDPLVLGWVTCFCWDWGSPPSPARAGGCPTLVRRLTAFDLLSGVFQFWVMHRKLNDFVAFSKKFHSKQRLVKYCLFFRFASTEESEVGYCDQIPDGTGLVFLSFGFLSGLFLSWCRVLQSRLLLVMKNCHPHPIAEIQDAQLYVNGQVRTPWDILVVEWQIFHAYLFLLDTKHRLLLFCFVLF